MFSYRRLNCETRLDVSSQHGLPEEPRAWGYEQNTSDQLGFGPRARHFSTCCFKHVKCSTPEAPHKKSRVGWKDVGISTTLVGGLQDRDSCMTHARGAPDRLVRWGALSYYVKLLPSIYKATLHNHT